MDLRKEHNFMICAQAHELDLGFEGDEHDVFSLEL